MWQDYLTEFSGILPRVVARLEPEIPYWPSSPSADYEAAQRPLPERRRAHLGRVAWPRAVLERTKQHHARFVTEYGFQSFPEMQTIEAFTEPQDRTSIFTPVMLAHQKNNEGNSIIHDYICSRIIPSRRTSPAFFTSARCCRPRASRSAPSISAAAALRPWAPSSGS